MIPVRCVLSPDKMKTWEASSAYEDIVGLIHAVGDAIRGHTLPKHDCAEVIFSPKIKILIDLLKTIKVRSSICINAAFINITVFLV